MGRISASGLLVPLASGASDGSNIPVGILASNYTVAAGATHEVAFCVSGDVVKNMLSFDGSDNLDTVISGRRLGDRIAADTVGIRLIDSDELTEFDNE